MGLFSKIFDVGKILIENPNAVDEAMDKVSNLKQNATKVAETLQKIQLNNAKSAVAELENKLNNCENQLNLNFLRAKGKIYEEKIKCEKEYMLDFTYSVPCKYDFLFRTNDYFTAQIGDKCGLINNKDDIVINFNYDYLECSSNGFILFKRGDKYGYMNFDEEVLIEPRFEDAGVFVNDIAYAAINTETGIKYGYINTDGQYIIMPHYDYAESFHRNGLTVVGILNNYGSISKGVVDKTGKLVVACKHEIVKIHESEIEYATESWHNPSFCDLSGTPNGHVEKYGYEDDFPIPINVVIPYNTSQLKYGFYTHTNDCDICNIEPIFDEVSSFDDNGYAIVKKDELYGIIKINK